VRARKPRATLAKKRAARRAGARYHVRTMKTTLPLPRSLALVTLFAAALLSLRAEDAAPAAKPEAPPARADMMKSMAGMMEHMGGMMRGMAGDDTGKSDAAKPMCECCQMMSSKMDMAKEAKQAEPAKPATDPADPHAGHAGH
jgi:hypothetical protein